MNGATTTSKINLEFVHSISKQFCQEHSKKMSDLKLTSHSVWSENSNARNTSFTGKRWTIPKPRLFTAFLQLIVWCLNRQYAIGNLIKKAARLLILIALVISKSQILTWGFQRKYFKKFSWGTPCFEPIELALLNKLFLSIMTVHLIKIKTVYVQKLN